MASNKQVYEIDGENFATLEGFYDEISKRLIPNSAWGHNLDAFNDILRGGFGTPEDGFILRWKNSQLSRDRLGYVETARHLRLRLGTCDSGAREIVARQLADAEGHQGDTVFDWLVNVVSIHCKGGEEQDDGVELDLC